MPLIQELWKQRQVDICESEANLVFRGVSRTPKAKYRNSVMKKKTNENKATRTLINFGLIDFTLMVFILIKLT